MPTGRTEPSDAQPGAGLDVHAGAGAYDAANDLVTWNHRVARELELAIDHVQIGATYTAGLHGETYLPRPGIRHRAVATGERYSWLFEH
jgi:hypothetical protein